MNLVALAVILTALAAFLAFHVSPFRAGGEETGWVVWVEAANFLSDPEWSETRSLIGFSTFISGALLIVASPFLVPFLRLSRLSWWVAVLSSGMIMTGQGGLIVVTHYIDESSETSGPALPCLIAALVLNFTGLLFIRREVPGAVIPDDPASVGSPL
jgi:hypothetical protein